MDGRDWIDGTASWLRMVSMLVLVGMLSLSVVPMARVHAATTTVSCSTNDLIAALTTANHNGQPDTLELAADCTYTLTAVDNEIDGPNGLPSIVDDAGHGIVINGNGAIIERQNDDNVPAFRIFHVAEGGSLELHQTTIQYGQTPMVSWGATEPPMESRHGGGIYARGILHLEGSTVQHNRTRAGGDGGGIYTLTYATVVDSTIQDNQAMDWDTELGGGGLANQGDLTVTQSRIVRNNSHSYGGGIGNYGTLTLEHSQMHENSAVYGGGISNQSEYPALITQTHFEENEAYRGGSIYHLEGTMTIEQVTMVVPSFKDGIDVVAGTMLISDTVIRGVRSSPGSGFAQGGIRNAGTVELQRSVIKYQRRAIWNDGGTIIVDESRLEGNWNTHEGGSAIYNTESGTAQMLDSVVHENMSGSSNDPGSIIDNQGDLIITRSAITNNVTWYGRGTLTNYGMMNLTDSLIARNSGYSNGIWNAGAIRLMSSTISENVWSGIMNRSGELTLINSTVADNRRNGISNYRYYDNPSGTVRLHATIIGGQSEGVGCQGHIQSDGYNLDSDGSCQLTDPTDQSDVDPRLAPLAENGGSTPTHALQSTSPAIDTIPANQCALDVDQRGVTRPQGQGCDIGAYERVPLDAFTQPNGPLNDTWAGIEGFDGYQIIDQQLDVVGGGPIYWQDQAFGTSQEVAVTVVRSDSVGQEQNLLLKVQGEVPDWRNGVIEILYDAPSDSIRVETFRPGGGWTAYPDIPLALEEGDRLGAQVDTTGEVHLYHNGNLIDTVTLTTTDQDFFNTRGGSIGMWYINAGEAVLDNFDGGTVAPPDQ